MADLYHILAQLCNQHQITPYRMCKDTGIQPSVMTDLKKGRRQTVKAETAARLANYFGVTVDYLLGKETSGVTFDLGHQIDQEIGAAGHRCIQALNQYRVPEGIGQFASFCRFDELNRVLFREPLDVIVDC